MAKDINDDGLIVGQWFPKGPDAPRGWLVENGRLRAFDYPGAQITGPIGMNDEGVVVGFWDDAQGVRFGFIARP
jgi:hypothetical protein